MMLLEMANWSNTNLGSPVVDDGVTEQYGSLEKSWMREIESLLQDQRSNYRERDLNMYRSGSAPPTVEGSLNAADSLYGSFEFGRIDEGSSHLSGVLSDDEMRSHPAYLSHYYSHNNINPRLPPPLLSKEEWRMQQRYWGGALSGAADWREKAFMDESDSLSPHPTVSVHKRENGCLDPGVVDPMSLSGQSSTEWLDRSADMLTGFNGAGIGARTKSFTDVLLEGLDQPKSSSGSVSHPSSYNVLSENLDASEKYDAYSSKLSDVLESKEDFPPGEGAGLARVHSYSSMALHNFSGAVSSSLSRSLTPEIPLVGRSTSPILPAAGRGPGGMNSISRSYSTGDCSTGMTDPSDIMSQLSRLHLSENGLTDEQRCKRSQLQLGLSPGAEYLSNGPDVLDKVLINGYMAETPAIPNNYSDFLRKEKILKDNILFKSCYDDQVHFSRRTTSANLYSEANSLGAGGFKVPLPLYQHVNFRAATGHIPTGYSGKQKLKSEIAGYFYTDGQRINRGGNDLQPEHHIATNDLLYSQYLPRASDSPASQSRYLGNNYVNMSHLKLLRSREAHLEALLANEKNLLGVPLTGKFYDLNHGYYDIPAHNIGLQCQWASVANSLQCGASQNPRFWYNPSLRSSMGGSSQPWHSEFDTSTSLDSTLLEEFKSNKTRSFELSDIIGHVVDFSTDQCGSRFIQQKLETASDVEKIKIFPEIVPHALSLVTDVFGNYVIQKLFEYGTESQRKELVSQLAGHVLPLSLQMYGCRVIQKALEVVDMEEKTRIVAELEGSVIKCVRDQNGNHVIQKCIECVPQDRIQFIISAFIGQVFALSTHPYGCRVIQRVLENCHDTNTQTRIMDEIMQSVCTLAEDQYGNYVIQHVLQHGSRREKSAIISKLAGQIVKMSQQKFASNVIEKCLIFGSPEEHQILVKEMLGSTEENEPLQAMMKDPFGNYVVQKVMETSDDQTRQLILSRIKLHLNTLNKYTFGKHIVSRVEKLLITGERRIASPA
ncbi:hypothetical protein Dimus_011505 [Dionaea muscipula]